MMRYFGIFFMRINKKWDLKKCLCLLCFTAQPAGMPEILKKSLHSCSVRGGEEVFIIGKNFLKDTKVIFHENVLGKVSLDHLRSCILNFSAVNKLHLLFVPDEKSWKAEAEIDMELFHQVEMGLFLCYFYTTWWMPVANELSR